MSDNVDKKSQGAGDGDIPHMGVLFRTMCKFDLESCVTGCGHSHSPTYFFFLYLLFCSGTGSEQKKSEAHSNS